MKHERFFLLNKMKNLTVAPVQVRCWEECFETFDSGTKRRSYRDVFMRFRNTIPRSKRIGATSSLALLPSFYAQI